MTMVSAVLRSGFVRKYLVVGHVIPIDVVPGWSANDWRTGAQIADKRSDSNIHDIVAKATPIGPTTGDSATAKTGLN